MKKLRYLVEYYLVKFIFFILSYCSIDKASNIGGIIAKTIGPKLAVSNVARKNIISCFPNIKPEELKIMISRMWDNLGRVFAEFPHIYDLSKQEFFQHVKVTGQEHLESIKDSGKKIIFFSGHLANWEICPRIAVENNIDITLIYRVANNKLVDQLICYKRGQRQIEMIAKGAGSGKKILKSFNRNRAIAMLVDQKMNEGIKVPFFGTEAMTAPVIAKLALNMDCLLIPTQIIRTSGTNYQVNIFPPLEIKRTNNKKHDIYNIMLDINLLLEKWIREHPSQWFWLHKRWPAKNISSL